MMKGLYCCIVVFLPLCAALFIGEHLSHLFFFSNEGATLLEGLTGHVVQLGAIRQETYPDAFNGLFWSYGLGSLDVLQPTQLVLDCGIEGSQAVELHGLTL